MKILVAVLDWGLGHASRSTVVVRSLLQYQHEVTLAGSGSALLLLQKEFPLLKSIELPAYNPRYPVKGSMVWKMFFQLPHFIKTIRHEHKVIEKLVSQHHIDCIISDNRYGCFHRGRTSVFITHQSNILMPRRFGWLSPGVRFINNWLMNLFDYCWVPDFDQDNNLTGLLSGFSNTMNKDKIHFIGPLSRFSFSGNTVVKKIDLLCVLSGPEPQRSIFENLIVNALNHFDGKAVIVRGLFSAQSHAPLSTKHEVINYLSSDDLQPILNQTKIVLARCGYSTIMDLYGIGVKAILIPTPGQTEQEYLARRLSEMGYIVTMKQDQFNLTRALQMCQGIEGFHSGQINHGLLENAITTLKIKSIA